MLPNLKTNFAAFCLKSMNEILSNEQVLQGQVILYRQKEAETGVEARRIRNYFQQGLQWEETEAVKAAAAIMGALIAGYTVYFQEHHQSVVYALEKHFLENVVPRLTANPSLKSVKETVASMIEDQSSIPNPAINNGTFFSQLSPANLATGIVGLVCLTAGLVSGVSSLFSGGSR